jgi:hypothetical protein
MYNETGAKADADVLCCCFSAACPNCRTLGLNVSTTEAELNLQLAKSDTQSLSERIVMVARDVTQGKQASTIQGYIPLLQHFLSFTWKQQHSCSNPPAAAAQEVAAAMAAAAAAAEDDDTAEEGGWGIPVADAAAGGVLEGMAAAHAAAQQATADAAAGGVQEGMAAAEAAATGAAAAAAAAEQETAASGGADNAVGGDTTQQLQQEMPQTPYESLIVTVNRFTDFIRLDVEHDSSVSSMRSAFPTVLGARSNTTTTSSSSFSRAQELTRLSADALPKVQAVRQSLLGLDLARSAYHGQLSLGYWNKHMFACNWLQEKQYELDRGMITKGEHTA